MANRDELLERFGKLLRRRRLQLDRLQVDLSRELGVSQASYSAWENGEAFPSFPLLLELLQLLSIDLADLLGLLEPNDKQAA
jgi:transcriptional regulator with XRE-family HTH domain